MQIRDIHTWNCIVPGVVLDVTFSYVPGLLLFREAPGQTGPSASGITALKCGGVYFGMAKPQHLVT